MSDFDPFAGRTEPIRAQRFRGAPRDLSAMVAGLESRSIGIRRRPRELLEPGEPERGIRLLPKAFAQTQRITETADHYAYGRLCRPG